MAISSATSSTKTALARYYQARYGFNRVDVFQDPLQSPDSLSIMVEKYGLRQYMTVNDASQFTGSPNSVLDNAFQQLSQQIDANIAQLPAQRQMHYANLPPAQQQQVAQLNGIQYQPGAVWTSNGTGPNPFYQADTLDLTDKALESLEDFLTLTDREKAAHRKIKHAIVTKEQRAMLTASANPGVKKQRAITSLYGVKLVVRK